MYHKNRGMFLETIINNTIQFYKLHNKAIFHKKSIPITFSGIKKDRYGKPAIKKGWISQKSTTDYYGICNGKFITFEAKSTNLKRLPLENIKDHQLKYIKDINKHGGFGFFIVYFAISEEFFIITENVFDKLDKKSISLEEARRYGFIVELVYPGILDFIPIINNN